MFFALEDISCFLLFKTIYGQFHSLQVSRNSSTARLRIEVDEFTEILKYPARNGMETVSTNHMNFNLLCPKPSTLGSQNRFKMFENSMLDPRCPSCCSYGLPGCSQSAENPENVWQMVSNQCPNRRKGCKHSRPQGRSALLASLLFRMTENLSSQRRWA